MRNFIYGYYFWVPVAIGFTRGIKKVSKRLRQLREFEEFAYKASRPGGVTHIDGIPIKKHPEYIAVMKAKDVVSQLITKGYYETTSDAINDFWMNIQFEKIVMYES